MEEQDLTQEEIQTQAEEIGEKIDTIFDKNGISITDLVTQGDAQKIVMMVKSDIYPEAEPAKVTMNFSEDGSPSTMDFEGPDLYSEEQGKQVLNSVMESLITLLEDFHPEALDEQPETQEPQDTQEESDNTEEGA